MIKQINQVKEFHKKFGIFYSNKPEYPPNATEKLRLSLMQEELSEVYHEMDRYDENLHKMAKELCDLLYVTYGTILTYGLQDKIEECFDEVHRSNMSKLGKDGKPVYREDGKLLKGDNYSPADIKKILNVVE